MFTSLLLTGCVASFLFLQATSPVDAPSTRPVAPDLRVTCFNLRLNTSSDGPNAWPLRKAMVIDHLRDADPDLLGTQEMLDDMRVDLVAALPGHTFVGVGREDGKTKGEYSGLFVRTERFDVVRSGTFWLSPTPDVVGSVGWDAALTRVCTWAVLRDKLDADAEFAVFNTHFDHRGEQARTESAKLVLSKVAEMKLPSVVMGDLNSFDSTDAVRTFVSGNDALTDTYRQLHPTASADEATYHGFGGKSAGSRIDYVFVRGFETLSASIDRFNIDGRFPSDHFPIHATLRRNR